MLHVGQSLIMNETMVIRLQTMILIGTSRIISKPLHIQFKNLIFIIPFGKYCRPKFKIAVCMYIKVLFTCELCDSMWTTGDPLQQTMDIQYSVHEYTYAGSHLSSLLSTKSS